MPASDTPRGVDLDAFHEAILAAIRTQFTEFLDVSDYPRVKDKIPVPACYVMMTEANPASDPGTDQLRLTLRFEALVVYGFKMEKSKRSVRKAAVELALFIKGNRWGLPCDRAVVEGIQADGFSPELDAYNVWRVDWTQEVEVGANIWDAPAMNEVTELKVRSEPWGVNDTLIPAGP